ncbi:uncharacterized protein LOC120253765 [Dioscorea cayenensis subsp. rotundata]|uniref:Uncharacterized protein LOC120253765 n=1 Tax=Dioscorea cayennensis subsp. rotundata TaxID=55577 RepID=A0AB40AUK3_DIOCR|nr:uncharacterized protein LOC120253765 [Dioscorea cayenensis subsp. rotundata]
MEFRSTGPPPFEGTTNPDEVDQWVAKMEKAFVVMNCTPEEKLRFGIYMIQGPTNDWYNGEIRIRQGKEFESWAELRKALFGKYFTRDKQRQLERQFIRLTQGNRSVDEYEVEFDRLSKYASKLVEDDQSRANRFEEGLHPHIRRGLALLHLSTYAEVVGCAKSLDSVWKDTQEQKKSFQKKRGRNFDNQSTRPTGAGDRNNSGNRVQAESQTINGPPAQRPRKLAPILLPGLTSQVVLLVVELTGLQIAYGLPELVIEFQGGTRRKTPSSFSNSAGEKVVSGQPSSSTYQKTGRPKTQGRVYALTQEDAHASNAVVSGTLPVYSAYACVLFDSRATHSFISSAFVRKHALPAVVLDYDLSVATPVGDALVISTVCVNCPVVIDNHVLLADLHVMSMKYFDVILGMD